MGCFHLYNVYDHMFFDRVVSLFIFRIYHHKMVQTNGFAFKRLHIWKWATHQMKIFFGTLICSDYEFEFWSFTFHLMHDLRTIFDKKWKMLQAILVHFFTCPLQGIIFRLKNKIKKNIFDSKTLHQAIKWGAKAYFDMPDPAHSS